jgi:hypothetical protein
MLSDYFRIVQGIPSKSASASDIFIVKDLRNNKVYFLKMFIDHYTLNTKTPTKIKMETRITIDTEQLVREIRFYKTLRERIIIPHNVRNLICIQGDGAFTTTEYMDLVLKSTKLTANQVARNVKENTLFMLYQAENREPIDIVRPESSFTEDNYAMSVNSWVNFSQPFFYRFMITPKIQSLSLDKGLVKELDRGMNAKGFMNYMFILFLTQYIMSCYGLNQNDLHWGNILLDDSYFGSSSLHRKNYLLVYNEEILLIQNRYILFMYDFDRSVKQGEFFSVLNDPNLISGGNCPDYHPKRDFIRTLCNIYRFIRDESKSNVSEFSEIQSDILTKFISNPHIRDLIKKDHHQNQNSCLLQDFDKVSLSCKPNLLKEVASNFSILNWSLSKTDYKRFTISELLDVEKNRKQSTYYSNVKSILNVFSTSFAGDRAESIYANIQFFNSSDIEYWNTNNRKTSFVNLVYDILKM